MKRIHIWSRWAKSVCCALLALCVLTAAAPLPVQAAAAPTVVGYYGGWASYQGYSPDKVPGEQLTHLNYAFADISSSGRSLVLTDPENDRKNFQALRELKQNHSHLKTLISVGGWDYSTYFSHAAATQASREAFAQSCLDFILEHGFDGVDLDWEYPVSGGKKGIVSRAQDKSNFTLLLQAVRGKLDSQGRKDGRSYLLTIAGAAERGYLNKIEAKKVAGLVDYIFLMAYDYHGSWDSYADLNAPLYTPQEASPQYKGSVSDSIQAYLDSGVPSGKLVLGMPFYGRLYEGVSSANNGLYSRFSSSRSVTYRELTQRFLPDSGYGRYLHSRAQVPYLSGRGSFLSYEDPRSIAAKVLLAKSESLLGFGAWELSQDFNSVLLDTAGKAWRSALPFADVLPGAWYYDAVVTLWERNVMNGTSENSFTPAGTLSRAMLAQLLYNLEGRPGAAGSSFTDVPSSAWYADAVGWAAAAGLVGGYGNGRFGPNDPVTREQTAVLLQRYARSKGYSVPAAGNLSGYPDGARVSPWAVDSVSWAVGSGLINGKDGALAPRGKTTRAEASVLLTRFLAQFP